MENKIETRIRPNFWDILRQFFGSNNKEKDVTEMTESEIEDILRKESPELLRTYNAQGNVEKETGKFSRQMASESQDIQQETSKEISIKKTQKQVGEEDREK